MDLHKKVMRTCSVVVLGALILRLLSGTPGQQLVSFVRSEKIASVLLTIGTGRLFPGQFSFTHNIAQDNPIEPTKQAVSRIFFSDEDASLLSVKNTSGYNINTTELLKMPLNWELSADVPTVLILHTHATESYTKTENYTESSRYRTLNCDYNTVSIGAKLTKLLEANGIRVIHDRTLHDHPSYNNSYNVARKTIDKHLAENPGILMVIDLHRDAMEDANGNQIASTVSSHLGKSAQLMFVMGTGSGGSNHANFKENLSLATKLQVLLEKKTPGICRPMNIRSYRYNQDASPGALLVEVGAAGNTRPQALAAVELLAEAIVSLSHGSSYK